MKLQNIPYHRSEFACSLSGQVYPTWRECSRRNTPPAGGQGSGNPDQINLTIGARSYVLFKMSTIQDDEYSVVIYEYGRKIFLIFQHLKYIPLSFPKFK